MERYFVDVKISGNKDDLESFILLCKKLKYLCSVGASRTIPVAVDGDGSANLKFDFKNIKVNKRIK